MTVEEIKAIATRAADTVLGNQAPVPITPEVIKIDWEPRIPKEVRDFWDANLENNPLRLAPKETNAGAFIARKIENAGDILRESAKSPSDMGYITEKLNAIRRELGSTDWGARLSSKELSALEETRKLIIKIPAPTEMSQAIKDLIDAVASRTPSRIRMTLDVVETKLHNRAYETEVTMQEEIVETQPLESPEIKCACKNLQPMAEWVKEEDPDTCRPCILGPVVQWYYQELKERGDEETAAKLETEVDVLTEDDIEQAVAICKDLDEIKVAAPEELRQRLEEFDCSVQYFNPDKAAPVAKEEPSPLPFAGELED